MAPLLLSVAAAEGDAWRKVELRRGAEQAGLKKLRVKFRVKCVHVHTRGLFRF